MPSSGKKPVRQHLPSHPKGVLGLLRGRDPCPDYLEPLGEQWGCWEGAPGFSRQGSLGGGRQDGGPSRAGGWAAKRLRLGLRGGWEGGAWRAGARTFPGQRASQKARAPRGIGRDGPTEPRGQWAPRSRRLQEPGLEDFPGGPVVNNRPSSAGGVGSIPGGGNKFPHAAGQLLSYSGDQQSQKRKTGAGRWGRQGPRAKPGSRGGAARGSVPHSVSRAHHCQQAPKAQWPKGQSVTASLVLWIDGARQGGSHRDSHSKGQSDCSRLVKWPEMKPLPPR